ncbi:MAG: methyl-accepting chemotaxis protein, partial [Firmicutes bacterium]|nr:methyl-accepting chemotaxis protein [Bacillota bacterium]
IGVLSFVVLGVVLLSVSLGIINSLDATQGHLSHMAEGDFSQEFSAKFLQRQDEFGEVARAVEHTQTSMKNVLNEVIQASLQIASTSQELSASTEETSASIEEVASTSNEFAATVEQMNNNSQVMVKSANQILDSTQSGGQGVSEAIASTEELKEVMGEIASTVESLGRQSREIGEIVEVITGIADQTNLLALNAAIEAARAGEHGRGFAVVADEVRNLAEQSANSTTRITNLIQSIQAETERTIAGIEHGVEQAEANAQIVGQTGSLMNEIIDAVNGIMVQIDEISRGILEINSGSHEMAATTEEQSASVDSIAVSAQELSNMAERLQGLVAQFKLS